jgi:hypothetical protein
MDTPLYSTITLFAEIGLSLIIYYTFYSGYKKVHFPTPLVAIGLLYETLFNITYMASRAKTDAQVTRVHLPALYIGLAAFHGILSLVMFIALVVFMFFAWRGYRKKKNFFKTHKSLSMTFLVFWTISIVSGILLYFATYIY